MNNLFQVFFSAVKAKIVPIWTKIKLFMNWQFLKTRVFVKIRKFFAKMLDVKPKHKKDYYGIGNWLVSKKLAFAIVILLGLASAYFVFVVNSFSIFGSSGDGTKTYRYSAVPLRFTDAEVKITARSGYVAYEGKVADGYCEGQGSLYDPNRNLIYKGAFSKNRFNGMGTLYYTSGQVKYTGGFVDNLFSGQGSLYRVNGSKEYVGGFLEGMKDGEGVLFDSAGNEVFTGNFSRDALMYSDFLGKSTVEAASIYTGRRTVYMDDDYLVNSMQDIDALYYGDITANTLEDEIPIAGIYVLSDTIRYGGVDYSSHKDMAYTFGSPAYEGNSYVLMPEAVAIHILNERGDAFFGDVEGIYTQFLDDVVIVDDYDSDYLIYLYTYQVDGVLYTFYCEDKSGSFSMYSMELAD